MSELAFMIFVLGQGWRYPYWDPKVCILIPVFRNDIMCKQDPAMLVVMMAVPTKLNSLQNRCMGHFSKWRTQKMAGLLLSVINIG